MNCSSCRRPYFRWRFPWRVVWSRKRPRCTCASLPGAVSRPRPSMNSKRGALYLENIKALRFTLSRDPKNSSWLQQKFKALLACSILWRCSSASSLSLRILAWKLSKYRTKFYVPDSAPLVPNSISHVSKIPRYLCNLLGVSGGWRFRGRRHDFVLVRANDSLHVRNWKV